jgi:uncharacterized protein involved in exopolysaccharide biosynthesis
MPLQSPLLLGESKREPAVFTTRNSRTNWTLRDIATLLFRRKWMILLLFSLIMGATVAAALLLPDKYQSRIKILVKNARADIVISPDTNNSASTGSNITETQINSEIALLNSKDLLEDVVRQSGLDKKEGSSLWTRSAPSVEKSVLQLEKELTIIPVKKADLIEISYVANSPEAAALVLQNLANLYLEKHLKLHRPPGAHEFFQAQADQYGQQLRESEARLAAFQQQRNVISLEQEKQLNLQKMADAQSRFLEAGAAVNEAAQRISKLQQQLAAVPARITTQSRSLPNQYSVERLSTMLVELQNQRTKLLTKFQPNDRLVKEVEQQIKDTTEALDKATKMTSTEQSSDLNPLRQTLETELAKARLELAGQQARRDDMAQQVAQYKSVLERLELATNDHGDLQRQVKEIEGNYELYSKKQEEARIADALDQKKISNVSIAESPVVQRLPVQPNRPLLLSLGLFLAFFVSLAGALAAELTRDTVHSPRELETLAGAPVLATIPKERLPLDSPLAIADKETEKGAALVELNAWNDIGSRQAAQ